MSQIFKSNTSNNNVKKDIGRYSKTLSKIKTEDFTQIHINGYISQYKEEPVLISSDGGSFQNPHVKKMEDLYKNIDGNIGNRLW